MGKNRYRLFGGLIFFVILYILILFGEKSDIKSVTAGILEKVITQTSLPAYAFMSNVDNNVKFNMLESILNDIYPMNEYILANEESGWLFNYDDTDSTTTMSDSVDSTGTAGESTDTSTEATTQAAEQTTTTAATDTTQTTTSDLQVISRNVITGTTYSRADLNNYNFVKSFYTVTSTTSLTSSILRPSEFLDKDLSITHDASTPQILIFHTHSQETFIDSVAGDTSTSIIGVGDYLTQILTEKYGYSVIHDTSVYDMVNGVLDRSKAYTYAEEGIAKILEQYPSIEVVIDLHRDGLPESTPAFVTTIDGKQTAKIMFFNGISYSNVNGDISYLYNPYRDDNLAMSLQMQLLGEAYYPDFLRHLYINAYRYCLHERGKSMLVEAGSDKNTVQEVKNAMEPFADILDKLLKGEKAY